MKVLFSQLSLFFSKNYGLKSRGQNNVTEINKFCVKYAELNTATWKIKYTLWFIHSIQSIFIHTPPNSYNSCLKAFDILG